MVIGSGEKVTTPDGSYEKITLDKSSSPYTQIIAESNQAIAEAGWSEADAKEGRQLVVDYMVHEFVDSNALENGDQGYQEWHKNSAKSYFDGEIYQSLGKAADSNVVLGNFAGANKIPALIHDGAPRAKAVTLEVTGFRPYSDEFGTKGIMFTVQYDAAYRVSDANAIKYTADQLGITPDQFITSAKAKDPLKDGSGENVFRATGYAKIVVGKVDNSKWNIIGLQANTDYDTSNFTNAS
jgi:hypothetical protein